MAVRHRSFVAWHCTAEATRGESLKILTAALPHAVAYSLRRTARALASWSMNDVELLRKSETLPFAPCARTAAGVIQHLGCWQRKSGRKRGSTRSCDGKLVRGKSQWLRRR